MSILYFAISIYLSATKSNPIDINICTLDQNCLTLLEIYNGITVDFSAGSYHFITFRFADSYQSSALLLSMEKVRRLLEQGVTIGDTAAFEKLF